MSDTLMAFSPIFSLSFRFGAQSTGSRKGEKRLIFQYVILYFRVCVCVCPYVRQTQFSLQLLLLRGEKITTPAMPMKAGHKATLYVC